MLAATTLVARIRAADATGASVRAHGATTPPRSPKRSRPTCCARFERYVRIDTQAERDRTRCPSTPGQLELAALLADELAEIGLADAAVDDNGYVTATLPASGGGDADTVIGLVSHVDTSPDAPGAGVEPIVHRDYDGGVIALPRNGTTLDPGDRAAPRLARGHDIVTASGDTLLGADDKAGVAEIMTAVAHLHAHPELPRPTIRICFTPDEEIGEGATLFDVEAFGARCAYTMDGSSLGEIQDETFSALEATITVTGVEVHPGFANGILVNAARVAARIVAALPQDRLTPETTAGREGFIHVYEMAGDAGRRGSARSCATSTTTCSPATPSCCARRAQAVVDATPGATLHDRRSSSSTRTCAPTSSRSPRSSSTRSRRCAPRASSRCASRSAAAPTARA